MSTAASTIEVRDDIRNCSFEELIIALDMQHALGEDTEAVQAEIDRRIEGECS